MQCEEVRDQFTDYLSDGLEDPARSEVQQHLIACESCRDEAEALKGIWMKLGTIPAEKLDSTALRARFDVMLEAYRHGLDHAPRVTWWNSLNSWVSTWWPAQPALQFGLTLALVMVAVFAGQRYSSPAAMPITTPPAQSAELVQMREELHDMRQMVAMSLMQQQSSAGDRLKGVNWSNQIDKPDTEVLNQLLDTLLHDQNVNVRLAAIDALKKYRERQIVRTGVLQALAKPDSPAVTFALIDYMVDTNEKGSVETLQQISKNMTVNEVVRKRAEWGVEQLQ